MQLFKMGKTSLAIRRRKHKRSKKQVGYGFGVKRQRGGKQITDLPDELLTAILSFMLPWDAAKTSVLSRRWRYLWYSTFDSLDFDPTDPAPEAAVRKQKFLRFLKDQWCWSWIEYYHTFCHIFDVRAVYDMKLLEEARRRLLEVEETHACGDVEEAQLAGEVAEAEKELKLSEKNSKKYHAKLEKLLRNFSVEKWIVVTLPAGLYSLMALFHLADRKMEFYFTIGGSVEKELWDRLARWCKRVLGIEELKPDSLYHLKDRKAMMLSSEQAAELGFRTFSRLGLF